MKASFLTSALIVALAVPGMCSAKPSKASTVGLSLYVYDSVEVLRNSTEGKKLEEDIQGEVKNFESFVQGVQTQVMAEQDSLTKQAPVLSKGALQEKQIRLASTKKMKELEIQNKREMLTSKIQTSNVALRERQLTVAQSILGSALVLEKNNPFVLNVPKEADKTQDVLAEVNRAFAKSQASKAKSTATKSA